MKHILAALFSFSLPFISIWVARRSTARSSPLVMNLTRPLSGTMIGQVTAGHLTLAGVLAVALFTSGCTTHRPLNEDPSEVRDLGLYEGSVFGSLLVKIAPGGGRFGRRAAGLSYRLTMPAPSFSKFWLELPDAQDFFPEEWELIVSPGEERTFVARSRLDHHRRNGCV